MKHKIAKQKVVPIYHVVQQFLNAKYGKKECARTAAKMKYSVTGGILSESLDYVIKVSPHYKELLWGNLFPLNVSKLGEGNSYFFKSENIIGDFNWLYILVSKYQKVISEYVVMRDYIEKSILLGCYDDAISKLEDIKRKYGVSIWYYETKLLIYSYSGKETKSLELLTEINNVKKDAKEGFVTFLLSYLHKRCSKTYSAFAYDSELENKFRLNRTEFQKDRYSYYLFRLNFYKSYETQDLMPVLIMESTNSLIDRYNIFINLIKAYFANSEDLAGKNKAAAMAVKFYRKTNDPQLASLVVYSNAKCLSSEYFNHNYIDILEDYYKGKYNSCTDKCRNFVTNNIPYFDILKIYCRSIIAENKPYSSICFDQSSILNQITYSLYKSMTITDDNDIINKLYQLNKNIYGLNIACGLDNYLSDKKSDVQINMKCLSLTCFDPFYCSIYEQSKDKDQYLDLGTLHNMPSFIIDYQKKRNKENIIGAKGIAKYIIDIDAAKIAFKNKDYKKALNLWEIVLDENRLVLPVVQCAIDYIYKCLIKLEKKQDAITLYISFYLKGRAYTNQISTSDFIDTMYHEKYKKGVKNDLDLQLFVFLNAKEDEKKSALLERYCNYKDVEKASDLILELKDKINKNKEKIELYLFLLASEDILRHMIYITSTKKMLEEQQIIAQYLTTLKDSPYIEEYNELNQQILDTMIVYQNMRKIDESKIYVNQTALIKYEFADNEGLYNQLKIQFENSGATNSYLIVDTISDCTDVNKDTALIRTQVKFTNKAFIYSACQMFTVIRDKFLFSKFGLKTYLSTRIRHGVLEGVLRSGYDGLHLLLTTVNNKYIPTDYWLKNYGLTQSEQTYLMKMLEKFSKGVNHAIDSFKEDALQIKTEDSDKGMFDYRLTPDEMCYATFLANSQAEEYEHFCLLLMDYMLKMANSSLVNIRKEITNNLKNTFNKLVDNLSQDIQFFSEKHFFNELNIAVINARTETIQKLAHIEKWFYLQDAKFEDFSLGKQMEAVWKITSKMYPNIRELVDWVGLEENIMIKSEYVIHISDMLTIFYNNMFSYSKIESPRPFKITLTREDDNVQLSFENNISEDKNILNEKFAEMLKLDSRLQMEGKSGLVKVKKIIKAELGCEQNQLEIKAMNNKCTASVIINLKDICV